MAWGLGLKRGPSQGAMHLVLPYRPKSGPGTAILETPTHARGTPVQPPWRNQQRGAGHIPYQSAAFRSAPYTIV